MALVQADEGQSGLAVLPAPPTAGNLIVITLAIPLGPGVTVPGFTQIESDVAAASGIEVKTAMWVRIAAEDDDGEYPLTGDIGWTVAEYDEITSATPLDTASLTEQAGSTHPHIPIVSPGYDGDVLIVAAFIHNTTTEIHDPDDGWTEVGDYFFSANNKQHWSIYAIEDGDTDDFDPGLTATAAGGWGAIVAIFPMGAAPPTDPPVDPGYTPPGPGRAILEIYVHDEDASRWGTATWATGPATGSEGIWSGAGWQDITPEGVRVHVMWGSRQPERGILAEQNAAAWRVETYDPDRILDPGNQDSPFYPQLLSGVPIRVSHDSTVIRTGIVERWNYNLRGPEYQGEILATDPIATLYRAEVDVDAILGNTLLERIQDAIDSSGIAIGGLPIRPGSLPGGNPTISDQLENGPFGVWEHVRKAAQEVLWIPYIDRHGGLTARSWGMPLDRGAEITDTLLEDLETVASEDGVYSKVRVTNDDGTLVIEREAAPAPRYGWIVWERSETTIDAEAYADAVLQDRAWPGIQYKPGTSHPQTAAAVEALGILETMELVTVTVAGAVSVQGRLLGAELWVEHKGADRGATWMFRHYIATTGSSALGLTTLVADGTGDTLLDDETETDYLEAD